MSSSLISVDILRVTPYLKRRRRRGKEGWREGGSQRQRETEMEMWRGGGREWSGGKGRRKGRGRERLRLLTINESE